ncbi:hypothetical protein LRY60_00390 [Candidatus Woesebacteria bacterium]|nr:hypothetical protein [Candidatus Woesebacteria bacterium]
MPPAETRDGQPFLESDSFHALTRLRPEEMETIDQIFALAGLQITIFPLKNGNLYALFYNELGTIQAIDARTLTQCIGFFVGASSDSQQNATAIHQNHTELQSEVQTINPEWQLPIFNRLLLLEITQSLIWEIFTSMHDLKPSEIEGFKYILEHYHYYLDINFGKNGDKARGLFFYESSRNTRNDSSRKW